MGSGTSKYKNRNEMFCRFMDKDISLSLQVIISDLFEELDEPMKEDLAREVVKVLDIYEKPSEIIGGCKAAYEKLMEPIWEKQKPVLVNVEEMNIEDYKTEVYVLLLDKVDFSEAKRLMLVYEKDLYTFKKEKWQPYQAANAMLWNRR